MFGWGGKRTERNESAGPAKTTGRKQRAGSQRYEGKVKGAGRRPAVRGKSQRRWRDAGGTESTCDLNAGTVWLLRVPRWVGTGVILRAAVWRTPVLLKGEDKELGRDPAEHF